MGFEESIDLVGKVVEAAGVLVIVLGIAWASFRFLRGARFTSMPSAYTLYRRSVGHSILLGLEFLVASDIIRTVAYDFTYHGLGLLAIIVLIRTFLSFTLEMETEGRFPWQQERSNAVREEGTGRGS